MPQRGLVCLGYIAHDRFAHAVNGDIQATMRVDRQLGQIRQVLFRGNIATLRQSLDLLCK